MFDAPLVALGGLTPRQFLSEYWQKKPLLMRGAVPHAADIVTPETLRKLAQRDDLVSRLILQDGGDYPWELRDGPFTPRQLRALRGQWALLVQEVDRVLPAARALLAPLAFMPRWRLDDVMASLAPDGAGVGAHIDHYDVFLVQGHGRRRWRIGNAPVVDDTVHEGLDVSVLQHFEWTDEYELEPGDVLYLPPRIAHEGVALGECITLSIGFRAPSVGDLLGGWMEETLLSLPEGGFYEDPDLAPTDRPGELSAEAVAKARALVLARLSDEDAFAEWLGRHLTEPRRTPGGGAFDDAFGEALPDDAFDADALDLADAASGDGALSDAPGFDGDEDDDDADLDAAWHASEEDEQDGDADGYDGAGHPGAEAVAGLVRSGLGVRHVPGVRLAYLRHANGEATLFADGEAFRLEADLAFAAALLADADAVSSDALRAHLGTVDFPDLLAALLDAEALEWDGDA